MAITPITDLAGLRTRVRLISGIEQEELDNDTVDILISIASEWFLSQIGTAYVIGSDAAYDNAVMYYSCYLSCIAQNGMGIERIQVGDLAVYYEDDQFIHLKELAELVLCDTLKHEILGSYLKHPDGCPVNQSNRALILPCPSRTWIHVFSSIDTRNIFVPIDFTKPWCCIVLSSCYTETLFHY